MKEKVIDASLSWSCLLSQGSRELLQSPSLYVGAMVFGALAIGVFREKIPATVESALDETL